MGRQTLRDLMGMIKDKASVSRAALLSKPNAPFALRVAVLNATTHDPRAPPNPRDLDALLNSGNGSRATAAALIEALTDRLQSTRDAAVALKCLIAAHHIVKRGGFILQDQLSVCPAAGGRNYLKLSNFRDGASPRAWRLSAWVRWYAAYVEHLLSASRILGFFLGSSAADTGRKEERVISSTNGDLLKEIDSVVRLIEGVVRVPESTQRVNSLESEVMGLVDADLVSALNEVSFRVTEFRNRLSMLSFGESVELACGLRRLEDCKKRLTALFMSERGLTDAFWGLISETKGEAGKINACKEERTLVTSTDGGKSSRVSESARFGDRVLRSGNSGRFSSGRLG